MNQPYFRNRHHALLGAACCVWAWVACAALAGAQQPETPPRPSTPPLSEEQTARIRELVSSTQTRDAELRSLLAVKQRELAQAYEKFELDAPGVEKLQTEIVDLQRQLLANYHRLQVELRQTVGPERFAVLSARINNALKNPPKRLAESDPPKR